MFQITGSWRTFNFRPLLWAFKFISGSTGIRTLSEEVLHHNYTNGGSIVTEMAIGALLLKLYPTKVSVTSFQELLQETEVPSPQR